MGSIFFESLRTVHEKVITYERALTGPDLESFQDLEYQRGDLWCIVNDTDDDIDAYDWVPLDDDGMTISQPIQFTGVRLLAGKSYVASIWGDEFRLLDINTIQSNAEYSCFPFMPKYDIKINCLGKGTLYLKIFRSKQQGK
jgi:hypothetical protein